MSSSFARVESLEQRALFAALAPDLSFGEEGAITGPSRSSLVRRDPYHRLINVTESGILAAVIDQAARGNQFLVQRFTLTGQLDSSFKTLAIPNNAWTYTGVTQDAQGRVLIVDSRSSTELIVTRYTASGDLDTRYGTNGAARIPLPVFEGERPSGSGIEAIRTTADGSAYVAFEQNTVVGRFTGRNRRWLTKLDANGTFNSAFGGGDGFVRVGGSEPAQGSPLGRTEYDESRFFLEVDPQGRAIVGNRLNFGTFTIRRLLANGDADTTFGTRGTFTANPGQNLTFLLRLDAQGRPLLAASGATSLLYRLNTAGQLDTTFSGDGVVDDLLDAPIEEIRAVIQQPDGKLLLQILGDGHWVTRLNPNGTRDTTYDGDARMEVVNEVGFTQLRALTPDGKLMGQVEYGDLIRSVTQFAAPAAVEVAAATGALFIRGTDGDDVVRITSLPGGMTRVTLNGVNTDVSGIKLIDATLGEGDNDFNSAPFNVRTIVSSGAGDDRIVTGNGRDEIRTQAGADTITSNNGRDDIYVGGGDKIIDSGNGGGNVWTIYTGDVSPTVSTITLRGGTTSDAALGRWSVNFSNVRADIRLGGARANIDLYSDADQLVDLSAMTGAAEVRTGRGNDSILTGAGNDTIAPYAGNDTVRSGAGDDSIWSDFEIGIPPDNTPTNDTFDLGAGNDRVADGYGDNTISGGDGDDSISTGNGRDSLDGGLGRDVIRAGGGNDTLEGGGSIDRLFGQAGDDRILGGNHNDLLVGGTGADTLIGGWGNDLLVAGDPNAPRVTGVINLLDGVRDTDTAQLESAGDLLTSIEVIAAMVG